ncbi:MAG: hypothetical protein LUP91_12870, partial [Methylococcaceae bacterium]|nr:hypothetical protein [Methylococcaceae bacterium]
SHARWAPAYALRNAEAAGNVRTTSPTAPSRISRTRSAAGGRDSAFAHGEMVTASLALGVGRR